MELLYTGDKQLLEKSIEVTQSDLTDDFNNDIVNLTNVMYLHDGLAIAAPQAGMQKRLFVIRNSSNPSIIINPEIVSFSKETILSREGCLSFPGLYLTIRRPETIMYKARNLEWQEQEGELSGEDAVMFQHELDHLNGILFVDKVSEFKLKRAKKALQKKITKNSKV